MHASSFEAHDCLSGRAGTIAASQLCYCHVVACVDETYLSRKAISHGAAFANALGAELILIHVLETKQESRIPPDPVEWDLRCRQAQVHVEELIQGWAGDVERIQARVMEGRVTDRICSWLRDHLDDLTVLCTYGNNGATTGDLGSKTRRIIDCAPGSILLVPAWVEDAHMAHYRRMVVPLDGSSRAERALPVALRLAEAQNAELLLVHAVPEPELTETGPLEAEGVELQGRLLRRNERVGRDYLDHIRAAIAGRDVRVRTLIVRGGDTRHLISRAITDESADLAVIASHGHSGHADTSTGSVAAHLIAHTRVPLLIVRDPSAVPKLSRRGAQRGASRRLRGRAAA